MLLSLARIVMWRGSSHELEPTMDDEFSVFNESEIGFDYTSD